MTDKTSTLIAYRDKLLKTNAVSKSDIVIIEVSTESDIITSHIHINKFTTAPSKTNYTNVISLLNNEIATTSSDGNISFYDYTNNTHAAMSNISRTIHRLRHVCSSHTSDVLHRMLDAEYIYSYAGIDNMEVSTPINITTTLPILEVMYKRTEYMTYVYGDSYVRSIRDKLLDDDTSDENSDGVIAGIFPFLTMLTTGKLTLELTDVETQSLSTFTMKQLHSLVSNINVHCNRLNDISTQIQQIHKSMYTASDKEVNNSAVICNNFTNFITESKSARLLSILCENHNIRKY